MWGMMAMMVKVVQSDSRTVQLENAMENFSIKLRQFAQMQISLDRIRIKYTIHSHLPYSNMYSSLYCMIIFIWIVSTRYLCRERVWNERIFRIWKEEKWKRVIFCFLVASICLLKTTTTTTINTNGMNMMISYRIYQISNISQITQEENICFGDDAILIGLSLPSFSFITIFDFRFRSVKVVLS